MNQLTSRQQDMLVKGLSAFEAASRRRRTLRIAARTTVTAALVAIGVFTGIRLLQTEAPALPAYVEIIDTDLALTGELHLARACERIERTDGQLRVLECVAWAPRP
jgi:predicted secreted protein